MTTTQIRLELPAALLREAEEVGAALRLAPEDLIRTALEQLIARHRNPLPAAVPTRQVSQGEIYWVRLDNPADIAPGIPHPYVVVQDDVFNHSRIPTVVVCALTSNLNRISEPGNVLLDAGEAKLPRRSVVEVSKVTTVEKAALGEAIGAVEAGRVEQILAGMRFLQRSYFSR